MQESQGQERAKGGVGLRFSLWDGLLLLASGLIATASWNWPLRPGAGIAILVGHFFLFCNVIRLKRKYELLWAGYFVPLVITLAFLEALDWAAVLGASVPMTVLVFTLQVRSGAYHGVFYQSVNRVLIGVKAGDEEGV